jgi:hypothetical protein
MPYGTLENPVKAYFSKSEIDRLQIKEGDIFAVTDARYSDTLHGRYFVAMQE